MLVIISFVEHNSAPVLLFHVMYLGLYAMSGVIYVFILSGFSLFSATRLFWLRYSYCFYISKVQAKILGATGGNCMYF